MSWNIQLRVNNIQQEVETLVNDGLTNPLSSNLDCSNNSIINCSNISSNDVLNFNAN